MILQTDSINFEQLPYLAKANPKYTQMFAGLYQIDKWSKNLIDEIINDKASNPSVYYIKTALVSQCYTLYLYNSERRATVGVSWPLVDFLRLCETKTLSIELSNKVNQMLKKFKETNLKISNENIQSDSEVNWIY